MLHTAVPFQHYTVNHISWTTFFRRHFTLHDSCFSRGDTAASFSHQLRAIVILAAEADVSCLVIPALARALAQASGQERPPDPRIFPLNRGQPQEGRRHSCSDDKLRDLERLRERVPRVVDERRWHSAVREMEDRDNAWAPVLAVFRATDAILCGSGRPRLSFVRPRSVDQK